MSADPHRRRLVARRGVTVAAAGSVAAGIGVLLIVAARRDPPAIPAGQPSLTAGAGPAPVPLPTAVPVQDLPEVNAHSALTGAPIDEHRSRGTAGVIAHPRAPLPVFAAPATTPFAQVRPAHSGGETWLPVIDQRPGWVRVLLPGNPAGATGWLDAARITAARSRHDVRVHLGAARLRLMHDGHPIGTWAISASSPLPAGRTFLLTAVRRVPDTTPMLLRLGAQARPGDPGLVTIHRWPAGRPEPNSHGCIRVPEAAMTALGAMPPGCLVRIYAR